MIPRSPSPPLWGRLCCVDSRTPLSVPARPELTGGRKVGVLVSHGFTGSPASMRPWADHLAELGYAVEMPLLPGHGTRWQDLNRVGWDDWLSTLDGALDTLVADNDAVVLCGLSLGGALVLRLAADRPQEVAGVVVVNPAVATRRKDVLALPVLKRVIGSFPGIVNDIKKPGQDELGYDRTPLRAAHSMMLGWKQLREDLPLVTAPLLYFRSTEDHVVDDLSETIVQSRVSSRDLTFHSLTNSFHVATLDHDAEQIFTESTRFISQVTG